MSRKTSGTVLLVLGVLVMLICLAADSLGLGSDPSVGWKQISGALAGLVCAVIGMVRLRG